MMWYIEFGGSVSFENAILSAAGAVQPQAALSDRGRLCRRSDRGGLPDLLCAGRRPGRRAGRHTGIRRDRGSGFARKRRAAPGRRPGRGAGRRGHRAAADRRRGPQLCGRDAVHRRLQHRAVHDVCRRDRPGFHNAEQQHRRREHGGRGHHHTGMREVQGFFGHVHHSRSGGHAQTRAHHHLLRHQQPERFFHRRLWLHLHLFEGPAGDPDGVAVLRHHRERHSPAGQAAGEHQPYDDPGGRLQRRAGKNVRGERLQVPEQHRGPAGQHHRLGQDRLHAFGRGASVQDSGDGLL